MSLMSLIRWPQACLPNPPPPFGATRLLKRSVSWSRSHPPPLKAPGTGPWDQRPWLGVESARFFWGGWEEERPAMGLESLGGAQSEAASEWLRAFDHARFRNPFSLWCSYGVSQEYRKFLRWPIVRTCKLSKPRTASGRSQDAEQPRENAQGCQRLEQACKCIKQICIKSVTRVFSKSKSWSAVTPGKWVTHGGACACFFLESLLTHAGRVWRRRSAEPHSTT